MTRRRAYWMQNALGVLNVVLALDNVADGRWWMVPLNVLGFGICLWSVARLQRSR